MTMIDILLDNTILRKIKFKVEGHINYWKER